MKAVERIAMVLDDKRKQIRGFEESMLECPIHQDLNIPRRSIQGKLLLLLAVFIDTKPFIHFGVLNKETVVNQARSLTASKLKPESGYFNTPRCYREYKLSKKKGFNQ
jgi:hypothetical protein